MGRYRLGDGDKVEDPLGGGSIRWRLDSATPRVGNV